MTRKKVKLSWITNDSARKQSLKKRKAGLLKKVKELTILCGVDAFLIIFSPGEEEPTIWPKVPNLTQLLERFQSMPETDRNKKMINQEDYIKDKMAKNQEHLNKNHVKNMEIELADVMRGICLGKPIDELHASEMQGLAWMLQEKKKQVVERLEHFENISFPESLRSVAPSSLPPQLLPPLPEGRVSVEETVETEGDMGGGDVKTATKGTGWDEWFIEMMKNNEHASGSTSVKSNPESSSYGASVLGFSKGGFMAYKKSSDTRLSHINFGGNSGASDIGVGTQTNVGGQGGASELGLSHINFEGNNSVKGIGLSTEEKLGEQKCTSKELGLPHINFDANNNLGLSQFNRGAPIGVNAFDLNQVDLGSQLDGSDELGQNQANLGGQKWC